MTITYRMAGPADAEAIDRIFRSTFCATFADLYRADDLAAFLANFTPAAWRSELSDQRYAIRLAEQAGEPVGFIKLGPLNLPVDPAGPALLLYQLYILNDHHGSGIARALMDWALAEAARQGVREIYLTVFVDNHRARRFYDRYGFEAVGRYDFMVGSQADEDIIMRKIL